MVKGNKKDKIVCVPLIFSFSVQEMDFTTWNAWNFPNCQEKILGKISAFIKFDTSLV